MFISSIMFTIVDLFDLASIITRSPTAKNLLRIYFSYQ